MKIEAKQFRDLAKLHQAVSTLLQDTLQQAGTAPQAILLSGGNTPLPVYQHIAEHPFPVNDNAYAAFTDDRHVPVSDTANNYAQTRPMLAALGIEGERVLRVDTSLTLAESAQHYHHTLHGFLRKGGRFSLGILGLGDDGHTCSLFAEEHLNTPPGVLATPVQKDSPPHRISVTVELLRQVESIVFLVAGPSKQEVIASFLDNPESLVAGRAVQGCRKVSIWHA